MAESNFNMSDFVSAFKDLKMPDYSSLIRPPKVHTVEIDEESTFAYQMQKQTNQILEKSNEQIQLLTEHNKQLVSNYNKLEGLYNLKEKELAEAKDETKKSQKYNAIMMFISIISMLIAIAAWLLPNILGGNA